MALERGRKDGRTMLKYVRARNQYVDDEGWGDKCERRLIAVYIILMRREVGQRVGSIELMVLTWGAECFRDLECTDSMLRYTARTRHD